MTLDTSMHQEKIWEYFQNDDEVGDAVFNARPRYEFVANQITPGMRVLNIGVGRGGLESILVDRKIRVSSLDPGEKSIERVRRQFGLGDAAKVGFSQDMPFADAEFDVVVVCEVLEHLSDEVIAATFDEAAKAVGERIDKFFNTKGTEPVDHFHKRLGKVMWEKCGMARNAKGLQEGIEEIRKIREDFWTNVRVPGKPNELNQELEKAGRVADFLELGELMCKDALHRNESCGGHFREEYQTEEGEALRDDENFAYVAAWEWTGQPGNDVLHKEELKFEALKLSQRSYK